MTNLFENKMARFYNNEKKAFDFKSYTLEGISKAAQVLGNPQDDFYVYHIAGTNGKGSVSYYLSQCLMHSGAQVGVYTSPHLLTPHERIRCNGIQISDQEASDLLDEVACKLQEHIESLSYFDVMTLLAFYYFSKKKVSHAVIECGLGGRLDSTNIAKGKTAVITDISYDHTSLLGDSLELITKEKCGIIKERARVFTSNLEPSVISTIEKAVEDKGAELSKLGSEFGYRSLTSDGYRTNFELYTGKHSIADVSLSQISMIQAKNFALAAAAFTSSVSSFSDELIRDVAKHALIPGRFELVSSNPLMIFDCAHNVESVANSLNTVLEHYHDRRCRLFLSLMRDKECDKIISAVKKVKLDYIYVTLDEPRAYTPDEGTITIVDSSDLESLADFVNESELSLFLGTFRLYETVKNLIAFF